MINPQPKEKVYRNPDYRSFVRKHPCCVCGSRDTVCHHEPKKGHSVMGGKVSDKRGVPLCLTHHTGDYGRHTLGRDRFHLVFEVDFEEIIESLNKEWEEI